MPIINRIPISSDNSDDRHVALVKRKIRNDMNYDPARNYDLFSIGSTIAVQWQDGGPWTHCTIVGAGYHNHNNRSCRIRVTKTGHMATRNSKHIKTSPITAEHYLRDRLT